MQARKEADEHDRQLRLQLDEAFLGHNLYACDPGVYEKLEQLRRAKQKGDN